MGGCTTQLIVVYIRLTSGAMQLGALHDQSADKPIGCKHFFERLRTCH